MTLNTCNRVLGRKPTMGALCQPFHPLAGGEAGATEAPIVLGGRHVSSIAMRLEAASMVSEPEDFV